MDDIYKTYLDKLAEQKTLADLAAPDDGMKEIGMDLGLMGSGSIKNVTSISSPEVQALKKSLEVNPFKEIGDVIGSPGETLRAIRNKMIDERWKKEAAKRIADQEMRKAGEKEASELFKVYYDMKKLVDSGKYASEFERAAFKKRIDEYYAHPYADKDSRGNYLMQQTFNEYLRHLTPPK